MCNYLRGISLTAEHLRPNADCRPQHLVVQQIFRQTPFGRFCGPVSFVAIFAFTVLRFLPFIRYDRGTIAELMHAHLGRRLYNEALHFWTVFAANFSETLYFSSIYWWTLYQLQSDRKWKSSLTVSAICSSLVSLSTLVALVVGQMYPWIRSPLLSEVSRVIIEAQGERQY